MEHTEIIAKIAEYWSFWNKDIPKTLARILDIPSKLDPKMVLAIQGVRRSGKSTLLLQLIERYELDPLKCLFINFEDPRLLDLLEADALDQIVTFFRNKHSSKDRLYFFFDEIQNVKDWHRWIHTRLERPENDYFIITGSNANLLSKELGSKLTGRHKTITLYPFSYKERLQTEVDLSLSTYIREGGFPAAVHSTERSQILRQYFDDIVEKDILSRAGISHPLAIKQLLKMIFESTGSECSFRKLAGSLGLSADTVASYIDYCEKAYLIFSCPYFSFSEKQRVRRNNKYYPVDSGFRRALITKTGEDIGKDFELVVFLALKQKHKNVYYWKEKNEVDFVVQNNEGFWPIQVSLDEPKERHFKGLEEFYSKFPNANTEKFFNLENFCSLMDEL